MPTIAIIDDNPDQSGTLRKALQLRLNEQGSDLAVIEQFPFRDIENYFSFIQNKEVCVLILDERLNDQSTPEGEPVHYKGIELVKVLRERLKDFPIYMVTTHSDDPDVLERQDQFEAMMNRSEITVDKQEASILVVRMIRAAQRFLDSNNAELSEFNHLSKRFAAGENEPELLERLSALQSKLELPSAGFDDRKRWLDDYSNHIDELGKLKDEIDKKLGAP